MKAILLAGGKGTRLRPLTIHTPKPIVPIFDRPFLHYQLDLLKQVPEIDEVILSLNYQPRRIEEIFGDGGETRPRHPLRRRAGAARHGGRRPLRRRVAARIGRRLQRRRADAGRSGGGHRAAPRAQGEGDDRADAGRQPDAPTAWSKPTRDGNIRRFLEKPNADEITCDTINAGIYVLEPDTFDRIPEGHAVVDRAQLLSVADRARRNVRRLRLPRLLDRHRHAGEVHAGAPRHHGRPLSSARCRSPAAPATALDVAGGARRGRRDRRRPLLHRRGRGRQGRRAHRPLQRRSAASATSRSTRSSSARSSGRTAASARKRSSGGRSSAATATSAATRSSRTASCSATSRSSPTTAGSRLSTMQRR